MQLLRLRKQTALARRGHKLLKDKLDGLVQRFYSIKNSYFGLHKKLEPELVDIFTKSVFAYALSNPVVFKNKSTASARINIKTQSIMGVEIPSYELRVSGEPLKFSKILASEDLPEALNAFNNALPSLIKLAEAGRSLNFIAKQIIETRRRVNALEYILIPELEDNLKFVTMKLDELERSSHVSILKRKGGK
ncbi:MAG: V-type H+-transporting ATPase subunit D [Candidatus Saganbacteria bacterium]|uniref:V-type H+-transporting ATPase subunit D n=1 Tax=Candidatus Saganbacteria bacterium TaxID=2575572 RepID=A0A833L4X2_UNCSA|nr:MAG: V-type H+-transporting ATPase subunit D [Candidatus Saganbacteria bacterium]